MPATREARATLRLKRVYEPAAAGDGFRILTDRLWPRGLSKEKARVDLWAKDVAPSTELRKWFNHDVTLWPEFVRRYHAELKNNPALHDLAVELSRHKTVTLLFGAKDEEHNQAVVLLKSLKKHW
ncbi:MAG: DUF488 family protein [Planctomycetes bacterium]|nr:DUF488 family protein [Planctomycetota bacterium]MCD7895449.1 DUF488 family protein [Planctomycetaceae bacterium]